MINLKIIKKIGIGFIVGIAIVNCILYFVQPYLIFIPSHRMYSIPKLLENQYTNVELISKDNVKLHGWFIVAKQSKKVILFCHGNAGNISNRGFSLQIFHSLKMNVFIFDYRGYGRSQGSPNEQGLYYDAKAAWNYLIKKRGYKKENIIIFGRSLGGAVATQLAIDVNADHLILESTFNSFRGIASAQVPFVSNLIYTRYGFNTERKIKLFNGSLLVIHSSQDDIIPYSHAKKIFAAANTKKTFLTIKGGHNDGVVKSLQIYTNGLKIFFAKID